MTTTDVTVKLLEMQIVTRLCVNIKTLGSRMVILSIIKKTLQSMEIKVSRENERSQLISLLYSYHSGLQFKIMTVW